VHAHNPNTKAKAGGCQVQNQSGLLHKILSETKRERARGLAQAVLCLPSKSEHEALSSNPSAAERGREREREREREVLTNTNRNRNKFHSNAEYKLLNTSISCYPKVN
jgi:hypothetical protein